MATRAPTINQALHLASHARLSELLNIQIQVTRAIYDEYDEIMGPDGQGWDQLLASAFPGSTSSGSVEGPLTNTGTPSATTAQPVVTSLDPAPMTSNPIVRAPPAKTNYNSAPIPAVPSSTGRAAISANARPKDLTPEQCQTEWRIIIHYYDTRAKMSQDQLAHAHAAFLRWFGWAPTKEEMQRSREVARGTAELLRTLGQGPWGSPSATEVWRQASLTQSIAKIKELKSTDWAMADRLAAFVGVTLKQEDKPKTATKKKKAELTKEAAAIRQERIQEDGDLNMGAVKKSLIVKLTTKAGELFPPSTYPALSKVTVPFLQASTTAFAQLQAQQNLVPPSQQSQQTGVNGERNAQLRQLHQGSINDRIQNPIPIDTNQTRPGGYLNHVPPVSTNLAEPVEPVEPTKLAQSAETTAETRPSNADDSDDAGPSLQLHQEMLMHSPRKEIQETQETTTNIKQEEAEGNHTAATNDYLATEAAIPTSIPKADTQMISAGCKDTQRSKVQRPFYNYGADVTPDSRVNALVAYLITCWFIKNKRNLTNNLEAMERLKLHAISAMPVVVQDSQAQMPTRGVFRWDGDELTWELSLKKIDAFVNMRAKNKREAEEKSGASSLENTVIDSTSTAKESITRIPSVQAGMPSPPKTALREPAKAAPRHPPYPDASLVAISELTPDSRANALVAHLAQSFYKTSGVDLIADGGSRRKIMLYAVKNEHPLRGKKRTQVIEMNFWAGQDLEWDLKGFELDALRDEWIKRFPEPEDSENEQDEEKDGSGDSDDGNTSEDSEQESIHTTRNSPVGSPSPTGSKRNHSAIISSGESASSDDEGPDHDAEMEPASKKARLSGSPLTVASSCGSPEYTTPAPELPNLPTSSKLSPTSSTRALSSRHSPAPSHESASRGVDMSIDSGASPKRGDEGVGAESETEAAITAAINFLDP